MHVCLYIYRTFEGESYFGNAFLRLIYCDITKHNLTYPNIIIHIFKKWAGGMDWINLAQNRYRWRAIVNAVMNLRVP